MKNFSRALKFAWPYRFRFFLSICCAVTAAAFWSLNFTAIYPVLKIIGSDQNLQQWADGEISRVENLIQKLQAEAEPMEKACKELEVRAETEWQAARQIREITKSLAKIEGQLGPARLELYRYQIAKKYIDKFLPSDRFQTLVFVIVLVVVGVALKGFFEFWQETLVGSVVGMTIYDFRKSFYRKAIHLDVKDFGQNGTHEMMARFTNDMEMLAAGIKTLFGKVIAEPLRAIGCLVVACWISWQLTVMFMVLVPIAILILNRVGRTMKRATRRLLERMSNIYKLLQESFQGIKVVKAYTMEPFERHKFSKATKDYYRKAMRVVILDSLSGPVVELLGIAAVACALLVGAYLVLNRETHIWFGIRMLDQPMEAETLLQLYVLLAAIADPVRKLSNVYTRLQSGAAASDRIFALYDYQPKVNTNTEGPRLPRHHGSIEFRNVCFSYEANRDQDILFGINLTVHHGETVALVGMNGSGKSTLVSLLPRFYDPDHGTIYIDDVNIQEVNLRSLRKQIGIVTQDAFFFDDTIFNNISYGNRRATQEEVENVAKQAFIHDFIMQLPEGYQTKIGDPSFTKLSGGQKQRIALARTILKNPSILILDEFTSQTDTVSESDIHRELREFMKGRTTFIITHRLNTLEIADRIVVLEQGRIIAVGTHQELVKSCNIYQCLHEAQFQRKVA